MRFCGDSRSTGVFPHKMHFRRGKSKLCERTGSGCPFHGRIMVGSVGTIHGLLAQTLSLHFSGILSKLVSLRFWTSTAAVFCVVSAMNLSHDCSGACIRILRVAAVQKTPRIR